MRLGNRNNNQNGGAKKRVLPYVAAILGVSLIAGGFIGISRWTETNSQFQKSEMVDISVDAGNLNLDLWEVKQSTIDLKNFSSDGTEYTVGATDLVIETDETADDYGYKGNTKDGSDSVKMVVDADNIYPGWEAAFAAKATNIGTLQAFINTFMGTMHADPGKTPESWDEQDPRSRITFSIYAATCEKDTKPATLERIATGKLSDQNTANFYKPGQITGVGSNDTLVNNQNPLQLDTKSVTSGKTDAYFIIRLKFEETDGTDTWDDSFKGNTKGDNIYENSSVSINFAIGATAPNKGEFNFSGNALTGTAISVSGAAVTTSEQ